MYKVSVIIPTYKRSGMLCRAIESVLKQTYSTVEVVVVDDNDPYTEWRNKTMAKMERYKGDNRVKYVCHDKNRNGSVARNTGIKAASGELVTYLDDDDVYTLDKIEKQVDYLLAHPEYRAVYCGWKREGHIFMPEGEGDLSYGILSGSNIIITNSIMMWRKDALDCGGWNENLRRHQEAAYLLNYFRMGGKIGRLKEVLVEFDTTDRTNVSNPQLTESQLLYILREYKDLIERCENKNKGASSKIYASRQIGIILPYAKSHQYLKAMYKFLCAFFHSPKAMSWALKQYIGYRTSKEYSKQSR